ncbi:hypothetical protein GUJ93_ZPchr0012g22085 [Zizania palustris]|uniref:Uncharacterized protein n=1 Tax=Zizania palustris TaxID=103762 RepID=A0A8J6BTS7_ZIZPA|nr:hypothetical protein GUJ93_ZPchr0012g22085 [Zizania palustris]
MQMGVEGVQVTELETLVPATAEVVVVKEVVPRGTLVRSSFGCSNMRAARYLGRGSLEGSNVHHVGVEPKDKAPAKVDLSSQLESEVVNLWDHLVDSEEKASNLENALQQEKGMRATFEVEAKNLRAERAVFEGEAERLRAKRSSLTAEVQRL